AAGLRLTGRISRHLWKIAAAFVVALVALALVWQKYRATAGEPSVHLDDRWHQGRRILARDGRTLRELPSEAGQRGRSLPLSAIGDRLIPPTLVSEDKGFFDHSGIDTRAIARAIAQNLSH